MSEFDDDLRTAKENLESARVDFLATLEAVEGRLGVGRRGGWTVDQVLQHVIDAENHYATGVALLRGSSPARVGPVGRITSVEQAKDALAAARRSLLAALDGVDEEAFYRMGRLNNQDYSVLSVLEDVAMHDREHETQIRKLLGAG